MSDPLYLLFEIDGQHLEHLFGVFDMKHCEAQVQESADRINLEGETHPKAGKSKVDRVERKPRDSGDIEWTIHYQWDTPDGGGRRKGESYYRAQLVVVNRELR